MNKEPDRSQRKALGKGLSALLPTRPKPLDASMKVAGSPEKEKAAPPTRELPDAFEKFESIRLDLISPGEEQPRSRFDDAKTEELAQSIRTHGIIQPITVMSAGDGRYRIIAGERRWRAAKLAALKEIPALVRSNETGDLLELALIENIQREDLNPIEIATAFQRLHQHHGLSHEQIAERTGKDRSSVTNTLRLLKLSSPVREDLIAGHITMGHARALLNLNEEDQARVCGEVKAKNLSVRATETLAKSAGESTRAVSSRAPHPESDAERSDPNVRAAVEEMSMALGTRVRLHARSSNAGRLEIEYYSQEDLDRIYSVIVR